MLNLLQALEKLNAKQPRQDEAEAPAPPPPQSGVDKPQTAPPNMMQAVLDRHERISNRIKQNGK